MDTADRVTTDVSLLFLAFLANPLQLQLRIYASRTDLTDGEIGKRSTNIRYRRPEMQENNIVQSRFLVVLSSPANTTVNAYSRVCLTIHTFLS